MAEGWIWVSLAVAAAIHREQIAEHGGGDGVRDMGLLESALSRPINLAGCGAPDIAALAASYAYGIARNHPFIDGNKRTAAVVSETFLIQNGFALATDDADVATTFLALAARDIDENALAAWFRTRTVAE